ncbi:MAG TPA: metallopeptidase TldD-related protein [Candidatus Xenobia bacterium]
MQSYFVDLVEGLEKGLHAPEILASSFSGEDSDFVRFNQARVRQAGHVVQRDITLELMRGQRHARGSTTLTGQVEEDRLRLRHVLDELRDIVAQLPEDPHLNAPTAVHSTERHGTNQLVPSGDLVPAILDTGRDHDMVGILASGGVFHGFASSLGQRNWHSSYTYNLDWSLYHHGDKAVKCLYAGFAWEDGVFRYKMDRAREELSLLARPARTLAPGPYRAFLAPAAVADVLWMVGWSGFGRREHETGRTCLLHMVEGRERLHTAIAISEDTEHGASPDFQDEGFIRPPRVPLIEGGCFRHCLTSPRSAREYNQQGNGASEEEQPESLDMAAGTLPQAEVLARLDTGLYVNNLWYLNYSDPVGCRMTGMTRFATFWVENGRIVSPVNVMRFDDTLYRMLGHNLVDLTVERDFMFTDLTYDGRSTTTARAPGALLGELTLTL